MAIPLQKPGFVHQVDEGHLLRGRSLKSKELLYKVDIIRFEEFNGVWAAMEGTSEYAYDWPQTGRQTTKTHVKVTEIVLNPDHEVRGSFVRDDVSNGATGWIVPITQIKYQWVDGDLMPQYNKQAVTRIDQTVEKLLTEWRGDSSKAIFTSTQDPNQSLLGDMEVDPLSPDLEDESSLNRSALKDQISVEEQEDIATQREELYYPHCGLYCMYAMIRLAGREVDYSDLVEPKYLGGDEGSSLWELRKSAVDYGLYADVVTRLTTQGLRSCPYGAILHVRANGESPKYDHFELFLGVEEGKARLCDLPGSPRLVVFADLAPRWDGRAIFLSDRPIDTAAIMEPDRQRWLLSGIMGVFFVLVIHFGKHVWLGKKGELSRRRVLGLAVGQVVVLGLITLLSSGFYHFASDEGLLGNAAATASLQKGHMASFIPKVSKKKVRKLLGTDAIFIDARFVRDYERGHLKGAISLPIDANDTIWRETLDTISQERPIVTYCQSAGCKFAEKVSLRLVEAGYSDVTIFKGGWNEWIAEPSRSERRVSQVKETKSNTGEGRNST